MKLLHLLVLLVFTGLAPAFAETATPPPPAPNPELGKKVGAVLEAYQKGKYDEALLRLGEADELSPNNPDLMNLRGAILVKQEKWDLAMEQFGKVLAVNPKYFPARFNQGEIPFMRKNYAEARAVFLKLLEEDPKSELLIYKIFLSHLLEKNEAESQNWLKKLDFTGNTPAYYFAQAAWLFSRNENQRAEEFVASAVSIYPPASNNLFAESLIDLGWLKRTKAEPLPPGAGN